MDEVATEPVLPSDPLTADLLTSMLEQARQEMRADTAAVLQLDPSGTYLDTYAAVGIDLTVRERVRIRVGDGFAGKVAATRAPVVVDHVSPHNVVNPLLLATSVRSLLGVPLFEDERLIGVLHVGSLTARVFDDTDVRRLQRLAVLVARAILDEVLAQDRAATVALQRSLLPSKLPDIEGLDMAARYLHAEGVLGGDWYDVFSLPGRRVGLVMGDVAGHGFPAAVIMGRLRSALRAYTLEYDDPADVLHRLDVKIQHFEPGVFATVLYVVADFPYDRLRISSAGHPAPLLFTADGRVDVAPVTPDLPMGAVHDFPRRTTEVTLGPGGGLVMFTDGLVERRPPGDYYASLERLMRAIKPVNAEQACLEIIDAMFHDNAVEDDTALLVARRES
ncbi:MAG: PP2C family protein-serine/threonine phosphatase [Actinomycetales bacterium]